MHTATLEFRCAFTTVGFQSERDVRRSQGETEGAEMATQDRIAAESFLGIVLAHGRGEYFADGMSGLVRRS